MGDYSKVGGQNADILRATINGQAYNEQPTSEISELLIELKDKIDQGGGGGGGTTNYNALSNKPQINGVTLENSKTTEELGINIPAKTSEMINDSGFITKTVNDLTNYTKTNDINTALEAKADKSTTYTKTEIDTALGEKVDKETGKGLSSNDFTTALKSKLDNIEAFANVNKINIIKVNGTPLTPDANKVVDITTGTGGDNIFLAQQNTTSAGDLIQAYEANKVIFISTQPTKDTYSYIVQNAEKISDTQCMLSTVYIGTENFADGAKFRKFTVTNTTWSMSEWLPQPKLMSGANIKTINGESILGSGNLQISGGTGTLEEVLTNGNVATNNAEMVFEADDRSATFGAYGIVCNNEFGDEQASLRKGQISLGTDDFVVNSNNYTVTMANSIKSAFRNELSVYSKAELDTIANGKVDKETGKGLSSNDFTTALKNKLNGIQAGAEVNDIKTVKVNGSPLIPDSEKAVSIQTMHMMTDDHDNSIYIDDGSGNNTFSVIPSSDGAYLHNVIEQNTTSMHLVNKEYVDQHSGGSYTAGTGINITANGEISVTEPTAKQRTLTQAQYDALSTEEKNNGTIYFITDGNGGGDDTFTLIENPSRVFNMTYAELKAAHEAHKHGWFLGSGGNVFPIIGLIYRATPSEHILVITGSGELDRRVITFYPDGSSDYEYTDTGWQTVEGEYIDWKYRKKNGVVYITFSGSIVKKEIPAGNVALGTLPTECIPAQHIGGALVDRSGACKGFLVARPSGAFDAVLTEAIGVSAISTIASGLSYPV